MSREFRVVIEKDEVGYFVGIVPLIHGCHTQAKSLAKLMQRMNEAVLLCLEEEGKIGDGELQFSGVPRIAV
jgi:predicted RNase H-like HicB family nuclease